MLLKVSQSVPWSWPVLTPEAKGRFKVKVLLVRLALKIFPAVPVAIVRAVWKVVEA